MKAMQNKITAAVMAAVVILISPACTARCPAGNNLDVDSRGSGYYETDPVMYSEFDEIYSIERPTDIFAGYQEKKSAFRAVEQPYIKVDEETVYVSCREFETDTCRFLLTHILIQDPETQIKVGLANDTFGGEREKTSDFARRKDAVAAINGSYFYYGTGEPIDICTPEVINDGQILRDGSTNGSEMCLRFDGTFFSPHPMFTFTAQDLVNIGVISNLGTADPLLIQDGSCMTFPDGTSGSAYPRTGLGVVDTGEYYIITAGDGGSYEGGMTYLQMQSVFFHLGCTYARSLDGGGSATLTINGELINVPAEVSEREVVDFVYFIR